MRLEPINIVCPACGNPNYTRRIIGEHDEYYNAKCLNCNSYFNFEEISGLNKFPQLLHDGNGINVTTNADRIRAMTDEELSCFFADAYSLGAIQEKCRSKAWLKWLKQECE